MGCHSRHGHVWVACSGLVRGRCVRHISGRLYNFGPLRLMITRRTEVHSNHLPAVLIICLTFTLDKNVMAEKSL